MAYYELTETDLASHEMDPEVLAYLERFRVARGLHHGEAKILDWGCGRGQSVIKLCEQGYAAVGVDIDPEQIAHSRALFEAHGLSWQDLLHTHGPNGRLPFSDDQFDFVFSEQVLEHVADLEGALTELARVTGPNGTHLHVYPGHLELLEDHLHMPLIHWFPKNGLRKAAIGLAMVCGMEPDWPDTQGKPWRERLGRYYAYSVAHTHFRPWRRVRRSFARHGFDVRFVTIDNPKLRQHHAIHWLSQQRWSRPIINGLLLTLKRVELLAVRQ